ncbi:uncharacterized protein MELLADRAFT_72345 [Melampsora larici-populina 98AG31]|uniref:Uncharacterized protein n=1 Tax=Melampsora larici-populina (strain 98AG31 / pathotype 3-4-7) TaxID=747676 RepID=F4RSR4_MELLP|nr:uncharacterized protein MELLADRAFT_72345 [Melampsora larici-populina 98AG31]EGG04650.1 hypothetical protein MELLADRAFT_72345 [Melampsora larici-populina 98AG31]
MLDQLNSFTGELARMNEASTAQNNKINELYEREITITQTRIENERLNSELLAAHRRAELELQQKRFDFESQQTDTSNQKFEALETKIKSIAEAQQLNSANLETKISSIDQTLATMMHHLVGGLPANSGQ